MWMFAASFWTLEATEWAFTTSGRVVETVGFVFVANSLCNLKVTLGAKGDVLNRYMLSTL